MTAPETPSAALPERLHVFCGNLDCYDVDCTHAWSEGGPDTPTGIGRSHSDGTAVTVHEGRALALELVRRYNAHAGLQKAVTEAAGDVAELGRALSDSAAKLADLQRRLVLLSISAQNALPYVMGDNQKDNLRRALGAGK